MATHDAGIRQAMWHFRVATSREKQNCGAMMKTHFKAGDIVQLKSGGPRMTIAELLPGGSKYRCEWFVGTKREFGHFAPESLEPVRDDSTARPT